MAKFAVGDKVIDRDGFRGTVAGVTEWRGSTWYDVRLPGGMGVRYDAELTLEKPETQARSA